MTVFADKTDANNNTSNFTPGGVADVAAEELAVKREELAARRVEAQQKIAAANAPWWRGATPLSVAVAAGALTIMGNIAAALYTGHNSLRQEKAKADATLAAEKEKNKAALIIQAVSTSDPATARRNVLFFVESGFFEGQSEKIKQALEIFLPVLPSNTGNAPSLPVTAGDYENNFWQAKLRLDAMATIDRVVDRLVGAKDKFELVAQQTHTPWYVVAVLLEREAAGSFSAYLGNGDPWNQATIHIPAGRGPFSSWEAGAVDAINFYQLDNTNNMSLGDLLQRMERFDGFGYRAHGIFSPFLWSYTDLYTKGKYVSDRNFDAAAIDRQIGIVALLRRMHELKKINLGDEKSAAAGP
jgi:lysozyme family protein